MNLYPYASGDLLKNPNSYFYTKYGVIQFLSAWRENREKILLCLGKEKSLPIAVIVEVSVLKASAGIDFLFFLYLTTNSVAICCASAALPPLPKSIILLPFKILLLPFKILFKAILPGK